MSPRIRSYESKGLPPFFLNVAPRHWVFVARGFETEVHEFLTLKMIPLRCLETSGINPPVTRCHIPEEQRCEVHRCESLKILASGSNLFTVFESEGRSDLRIVNFSGQHPHPADVSGYSTGLHLCKCTPVHRCDAL
jgi:hypothetical protein